MQSERKRNHWQVILVDGSTMEVPRTASRTPFESIKRYGTDAVIMRCGRTKQVKALMRARNITVRQCIMSVIKPNGEEISLVLPIY